MTFRDLAELSVRNLREALLRNSLTTIGIGVGVASLVAMLSLGLGLQEMANKRLLRTGLFDAIIVTPRPAARRAFGQIIPRPFDPPPPLDANARHELESLPNVAEVYPDARFPTEIHFEGKAFPTTVAGIPQSAVSSGAFDGMKGSFFSGPAASEAILQIDFARQLSPDPGSLLGKDLILRYAERQALPPASLQIGSGSNKSIQSEALDAGFSIVPREEKLRIIGTVDTQPAAGLAGLEPGRLMIPLDVAEKLGAAQVNDLRAVLGATPLKPVYRALTVRVKSPSAVKSVEDSIRPLGFGTFSLVDATDNLRIVFAVFDLLLGIFGSLALIVASLGIINTLVMAILERRREIGVLKALGAADPDIRKLFFMEAGVMGFLGGILGVILGGLIGFGMNFATNLYLRRQQLPAIIVSSIPWWMIGLAITFSVVVSLAAGMYPASRAAQLNPVEALRYE